MAWLTALWDLAAFAIGLGLAWREHWQATDLVWSLWLSSLVVGYSSMVWSIAQMTRLATAAVGEGGVTMTSRSGNGPATTRPVTSSWAVIAIGLFVVGFFTVHFGGFHFVHSVFLSMFFPIDGSSGGFPGLGTYATVFRRYWTFLPATFIAERAAFTRPVAADGAGVAKAIAAIGPAMTGPYRNVARMHVLIFVFFATSLLHLDNIIVVAIVYAAYFFPWRAFSKRGAAEPAENAT